MRDPRIPFRSRELAAVLAFLIPGAGHFYQGRRLKAGIFFSGILTLFFGGMILANWQPVYSQVVYSTRDRGLVETEIDGTAIGTKFSLGYAAQAAVGLPAMPALLQQFRMPNDGGMLNSVTTEVDSRFSGAILIADEYTPVIGNVKLSPGPLGTGVGTLTGTTHDGRKFEFPIADTVRMGREVFGSPRRSFEVPGVSKAEIDGQPVRAIEGSIDRSFLNWYQAPRDDKELDRLHNKLSHLFDIGAVCTWIAGLLNIMAIWDAYDGPAYGYGDEEEDEEDSPSESKTGSTATQSKTPSPSKTSTPQSAATTA